MSGIRQLGYRPPDAARAHVETMPFQRLRELNGGASQRGDFHVLAVVEGGRGSVSIDFATRVLGPKTVVSIRPGVVHRWVEIADLAGDVVLFVPTAPTPRASALVDGLATASSWRAPDATWPLVAAALQHLRLEVGPGGPDGSRWAQADDVADLLLSALLVRLAPPLAHEERSEVFHRFRTVVEQGYREHHDVGHYARALGYDPRTLSRAAHAATGRSAKSYLDDRVLLEAKRLLAHDQLSPARCADRLGFPDASNFSAFFLRRAGVRPGAWQRAEREQAHRP